MCRNVWMSRMRTLSVCAASVLTMALAAQAHAQDATTCKKTLASETASYERQKLSLLTTCEDQKRSGTLPANTTCAVSATKALAKLLKTAQNNIKKGCCAGKNCPALSALGFGSDGSSGNPVLAKACSAGDFAGARCTRETDCPGICANGGEKEGLSCSFNSSCADHACATGNCIGGKKDGKNCDAAKDRKSCIKGGGFCPTHEAPGPPGAGNLGACNGGTNNQGNCAADSDCPGGGFCDNGCNTGKLLDNKNGLCEGALCASNKDCGLCTDTSAPFFQQSCSADADCGKICAGGDKPGNACKTAGDCPNGTCGNITGACKTGTCSGGFCSPTSGAHGRSSAGLCAAAARCPNFKNDMLPGATCDGGKKNGLACKVDKDCGKVKGVQIKCNPGCDFALTNAIDVGNCLLCNGDGSATQLNSLYYGDLTATSSNAALESCKTAVGKAGATFFDAKRAALATCEATALGGSGSCPDGTATAAIDAARATLTSTITGACSGMTADDIASVFTCPAVTVPGASASCAGVTNRGSVSTVSDLADCIACVTDFHASCTDRLSAPATGAPFPECNSLCGNGRIDGRCSNNSALLCASSIDCPGGTCLPIETCDDGNPQSGDNCPSNCSVTVCTPSGSQSTLTVSFSAPTALGALSVFVEYPDGVVSISGQGTSTDKTRFTADPSLFFTPNDLDYAVRVALLSTGGAISSPAFTVQMDSCDGAPGATSDQFHCHVESASDTSQNVVSGVQCTVSIQ